MPLATFTLFTVAGSGLWNGALVGLGYLLGTQYELIEQYSRFLNYAVYAALGVALVLLIIRRTRRAKARKTEIEGKESNQARSQLAESNQARSNQADTRG